MSLIIAGGWTMVPLLLISIIVCAIVIDRMLVYSWNPMPSPEQLNNLLNFLKQGKEEEASKVLASFSWLSSFSAALRDKNMSPDLYENNIVEGILEIREFLEKRLSLLNTLAKIAPLLGLLGTVIGMIQTFSVVATLSKGINMEALADGIWQALITTATGLIIAIPAILLYHVFLSLEEKRLNKLNQIGSVACLVQKEGKQGA